MSGAQQAAPAGMRRIPFVTETYDHPSLPLSAKRLINLFAEKAPADARSEVALIPTQGLDLFQALDAGPIRAMNSDAPGRLYVASGTHFYRLSFDTTLVIDDLGVIGTPGPDPAGSYTLSTTIAVGSDGFVVCVPPNAYTGKHGTGAVMHQIGGTFPGATSVAYLDAYWVFTMVTNSAGFFISNPLDPDLYNALDFAYSDAMPNVVRRVLAHRGELWFMGESGHEIWYDAGQADFPFRRQSGGVIARGATTPRTLAQADGSVWWIGTDHIVYRSKGYQAQRVSTHGIESYIRNQAGNANYGMAFQQSGHWFYAVSFGTARTLVYDVATAQWHDRSSATDGNGSWRFGTVASQSAIALFGDTLSGGIYSTNLGTGTEAGTAMYRQATLPPLYAETRRSFCYRVEVELEVGDNAPASLTLEWSDDGGKTFGTARVLAGGIDTNRRKRVFTTRLGSFRERVFRISYAGLGTLYAVDADIGPGAT